MQQLLGTVNPIITLCAVLITIAGAVVCIAHPATLSFKEYVDAEAVLLGLVAVGRGLAAGGVPTTPAR